MKNKWFKHFSTISTYLFVFPYYSYAIDSETTFNLVLLSIILIVLILIFLICREIVCWYWKINIRVGLLTEIRDLLKDISMKTDTDEKVLSDKAIEIFQLGEEKEEIGEDQDLNTWRCTCGAENVGSSAYCSECNTIRRLNLPESE